VSSETPRELYKIKTIAAMTGFNPTLLRAWERRYELLVPTRTVTGHRLYTQDDLRVLRRVRSLLDQGRSIGEVVAQGRERLLHGTSAAAGHGDATAVFPELQRLHDTLIQGALELDDRAVNDALDEAFGRVSVVQALEQVVVPAAHEIGRLWAQQLATVASEHLLTAALERRLHRLVEMQNRLSPATRAICCTFPDEYHELGALIVSYYVMQFGVGVLYLGAALPFDDLARTLQRRRPDYVLLSVTRAALLEVHKPALLQMLMTQKDGPRFLVGGSGLVKVDPDLSAAGVLQWPASKPLGELSQVVQPRA
jgi:MerR family transcriptional regulator, light-induced transcriptional regulator